MKYMGYKLLPDIVFGIFVATWLVTRHVFYIMVCWSIYAHAPTAMAPGCYFSDGTLVAKNQTEEFNALGGNQIWPNLIKAYTDRLGPICWNPSMRYGFLALLLALQFILLLWFTMIIKVVYKVVSGQGADDVRSEDECDDNDEIEEEEEVERVDETMKSDLDWAPMEQEVGVEALNFARKNYKRSQNRSSNGRASGISIPGHGDRKELLGRIGCDKPS
jgi:acyl-CoA-dependent ceramide synthase